MAIYKTKFYGLEYKLRADFAQAADPIYRDDAEGEWEHTGKQVADFGHRPDDAMRWELEQWVLAGGDDIDMECNAIEDCVDNMERTEE